MECSQTSHEILRHFDTCPVCHADLAGERALRKGVRRAFQNARQLDARPEFIAHLRTSLGRSRQQEGAPRGVKFQGRWALAATVLLALACGLAYRGRDWMMTTGALARAVVGDHRDCALLRRLAGISIPLEEATERYGGTTYRILERVPPSDVMTMIGPAHIVRRHACFYAGRRFAHVVFEYRGELVSLLVTAADEIQLTLPGETPPHVTHASRIEQTSVVSFRASNHAVFLVGNIAPADLSALADVVAGPLYRELAGV
jgi:hypothetical protein